MSQTEHVLSLNTLTYSGEYPMGVDFMMILIDRPLKQHDKSYQAACPICSFLYNENDKYFCVPTEERGLE